MTAAILAAKSAGAFLKKHFYDQKKVDEASQNDIKLELDKLSQKLITEEILSVFPTHAVLGEEGYTGDRNSEYEWIVDPIDGTVNYFYTIPWFCVSIALRRREFAMLRSVGLTQRGFARMMDYECIIYGARALLWGLPASVLVTYGIYRSVAQSIAARFYIPWYSVAIAVGSVFVVVFATMLYATRKIRSENPIEALKQENL